MTSSRTIFQKEPERIWIGLNWNQTIICFNSDISVGLPSPTTPCSFIKMPLCCVLILRRRTCCSWTFHFNFLTYSWAQNIRLQKCDFQPPLKRNYFQFKRANQIAETYFCSPSWTKKKPRPYYWVSSSCAKNPSSSAKKEKKAHACNGIAHSSLAVFF